MSKDKSRKTRNLQKAIDSLCMVSSSKYINPSAVAESMVLHAYSGSRQVVDMYAATNASGGHNFMSTMLQAVSMKTPKFPPGDISVAFDNTQFIGKDHHVSAGSSNRLSVSTTVCVFKESIDCKLQSTIKVPTILPVPSSNPSVLWALFNGESKKWDNVHRLHRRNFIQSRLDQLKLELNHNIGSLSAAEVVELIKDANYEKSIDYSRVKERSSSVSVTDMENLSLNPNSSVTLRQVLDQILVWNEESDPSRHWLNVYCDGLPYCIASGIISKTLICETCKLTGTIAELEGHACDSSKPVPKYEKILLRPGIFIGAKNSQIYMYVCILLHISLFLTSILTGAGHIEMNLVRTVFTEFFDVFIKPIAMMLGFVMPRSLDYCKAAGDHHKAWEILQVNCDNLLLEWRS